MRVAGAVASVGLAGLMFVANACAHTESPGESAGAAGGSAQRAQPESEPTRQPSGAGVETDQGMGRSSLVGRVASVDPRSNTLILENGVQIEIGSAAQFTKDGKPASFGDIVPGDEVRASFSPGSKVLEGFTVSSSPAGDGPGD